MLSLKFLIRANLLFTANSEVMVILRGIFTSRKAGQHVPFGLVLVLLLQGTFV